MKIIGYMLGTDPDVLTQLLLRGYETLPLSNGYDNHGKYITHLTTEDHISLIVGYLHKFFPLASQFTITELLKSARVNKIPIVFVVPKELHDEADKLVADEGIDYKLSDPADLSKTLLEILET
ncbi:MAG: hypothetical protein PVH84_01585 [Candidatus Aminicenantes bacterium]|jgi:hypothetical protein